MRLKKETILALTEIYCAKSIQNKLAPMTLHAFTHWQKFEGPQNG
jgi:hypothetical protein